MRANKYKIKPTTEQQEKLAVQFGHARFVYNYCLSIKQDAYKDYGVNVSRYGLQSMLPAMKRDTQTSWLKEAHSQVLQSSLLHLDTAFKNFFEKRAKFPRFKSKYGKQSIQYPQGVKIKDNTIFFPKVGWVKAVIHRDAIGKIKTVTISKDAVGNYYASVLLDDGAEKAKPLKHVENHIGLDAGIAKFITTSNKEYVGNPRFYERQLKNLRRKQKSLSRKKKGSANYAKAKRKVAKIHKKVTDARNDFQHQLSKQIADKNQAVFVEKLNIRGMSRNKRLAKQMLDIGWNDFTQKLAYKLDDKGGYLIKVDHKYTSQKCSSCGHTEKENRKTQDSFKCLSCGHTANADYNASLNIQQKGIVQIKAEGITVSARRDFNVSRIAIDSQTSMKREAPFIALCA